MIKASEQPIQPVSHSISLINREDLSVSGVLEVLSATENSINIKSSYGPITITGTKLKIKNLNETSKEVQLQGHILEIKYNNGKKRFLEKCFK